MDSEKLRLTEKDIQLLTFLRKYRIMLAADAKRIYKGKDYHYKRLKILEKERYIKRKGRYIGLGYNGMCLMRKVCYEYSDVCRKDKYQDRLKAIVKIAMLGLDSSIEFVPSWEIKDNDRFTDVARKYIGTLNYRKRKALAYYIANNKSEIYIRQVINDIQKSLKYENIIIFMEDLKCFNKNSNYYFTFGNKSTVIVKATSKNLEIMRWLEEIDLYEILTDIYKGREILLSNWEKADYMINKQDYVVLMPFIDTEKLHRLNIFYKDNKSDNRKIDIITLKENKTKINEILTNKTNIIELDKYLLGGENGEKKQD